MVTDSVGTELFLEYKGRKVADASSDLMTARPGVTLGALFHFS
jgi:hypothetical protein